MTSPHILVVDDEPQLTETLAYNLRQEGFRVSVAHTGGQARDMVQGDSEVPDLVLLDLMLPDESGVHVCRAFRENERSRTMPVIMLTARDTEIDRVVGFEVGADDYVTKPFSVRELILRVRAVLRRSPEPAESKPAAEVTSVGRLTIDPIAHRVTVSGKEVSLTALEFRLLHTLVERRGRVQTRAGLLEDVWEMKGDVTTRTVDTLVKRLREKLGPVGSYVETIRGVGYRLASEPES